MNIFLTLLGLLVLCAIGAYVNVDLRWPWLWWVLGVAGLLVALLLTSFLVDVIRSIDFG